MYFCPRGIKIAVLELFRVHTDKIRCEFSSSEPSRRRIGENLMGGSQPGIPFPLA
jgi:hypothetical protein